MNAQKMHFMSDDIKMKDAMKENQFIIYDIELTESDLEKVEQASAKRMFEKIWRVKEHRVNVEDFQNHFADFLGKVHSVLANCKQEYEGFKLDQIEITGQISGSGQIGFMGSHIGMTGTGGINFVFKRSE
jgi:hypothetical protein